LTLSTAIGQNSGKAIHIVEYEEYVRPYQRNADMSELVVKGYAADQSNEPDIGFKPIILNGRIEAKFILE
jgi:hypothetical protein